MFEFVNVNWTAVVVAALAQIIVGGIWNGILFVRQFYATHEVAPGFKPNPAHAFIMVALTIFNSYILAVLFTNLEVATAQDGAVVAFWLWAALMLPFIVGTAFATNRNKVIPFELGHTLLAMLAAGIILGIWK